MRTSWPINATGLKDRVNEENNILVGTRTSNFLKNNYDASFYPLLKELMVSTEVPKEYASFRSAASYWPFLARFLFLETWAVFLSVLLGP